MYNLFFLLLELYLFLDLIEYEFIMDVKLKEIIWQQYGAALDTLENAITAYPDDLWGNGTKQPEFWYLAYHTIFFLDFYFSDNVEGFAPPAPFTLSELDPEGILPERVYTKEELLTYLVYGSKKCRDYIKSLTDESNSKPSVMRPAVTETELLLYTMRHVQHHAAQLNLILRQETNSAPGWVSRAKAIKNEE